MKILFHAEPLIFHGRPFHYAALFDFFVMLANLLRPDAKVDARFIANPALAERAIVRHGLSVENVYSVSDSAVRDITGLSAMETLRGVYVGSSPQMVHKLAGLYSETLGEFRPDVIITFTPAQYLEIAFPNAILLHVDGGLFSRDPLPHVFFLDSNGLFRNSAISAHAEELKALPATPSDKSFVCLLRAEFRQRLLCTSPFHSLERDLRSRFRRLLLLPLQFSGEFGFDLNCNYDRQGSYLLDVLNRVAPDTAVVVTEHPTALWLGDVIDPETKEYVSRKYANVFFAPGAREGVPHAGQLLLHHTDAVACVSSSLGMQAVFFDKPLVALGSSHLGPYASWRSVESFNCDDVENRDLTGGIAWMMRHYYLPTHMLQQGEHFSAHLTAIMQSANNPGLGRYPGLKNDAALLGFLLAGASIQAA